MVFDPSKTLEILGLGCSDDLILPALASWGYEVVRTPAPTIGRIVHDYLWRHEFQAGEHEKEKIVMPMMESSSMGPTEEKKKEMVAIGRMAKMR